MTKETRCKIELSKDEIEKDASYAFTKHDYMEVKEIETFILKVNQIITKNKTKSKKFIQKSLNDKN